MSTALDDWDLDERLRHIGRILASESPSPPSPAPVKVVRIDAAHEEVPPPPAGPPRTREFLRKVETVQAEGILPALTWLSLLAGTMAVVCGGVLVAWSWIVGRPELWRMGQPIALGGACALVVGLVLQLDHQWQERRAADGAEPHGADNFAAARRDAQAPS